MTRRRPRRARVVLAVLVAGVALCIPATASAAQQFAGLTSDNQVALFRSDSPGNLQGAVPVVGLQANEQLVALSSLGNRIYGLGSSNRLYTVDPITGVATALSNTPFSPPLQGTSWTMAIDVSTLQARVISDTNQNLRISVANGQVAGVDPGLQYAPTDAGVNTTPAFGGLAYSLPPSGGAGQASLYAIDTTRDALVTSSTPAATVRTIGALGVDASGPAPLIVTPTGAAYAALRPGAGLNPRLYTIDLSSGAATPVTPGTESAAGSPGTTAPGAMVPVSTGTTTPAPGALDLSGIAPRTSSTATVDTPIIALAYIGVAPDDQTRPIATIDAQEQPRAASLRRSGYRFRVGCNEACSVSAQLRIGRTTLAPTTGAVLATAGKVNLATKLTPALKKALRKDPTQRLSLKVTVTDAAGHTVDTSRRGATRK